MKFKSLLVVFLSILMIGFVSDADAQKRKKNRYKKRKKTSKNVSSYRGGPVGFGRFKPNFFLGANLSAGNYYGDLAPIARAASTDISFTRPGFGIYGGYRFHHSLAVRAALNWVRVSGNDSSADPTNVEDGLARYARNLSFRNDIKEFQLGLEVYLLPNHGGVRQRVPINGYLFVGGAVFLHEPMAQVPDFDYQTDINGTVAAPQAKEWVKLRPLETEGVAYSNVEFSIPIALGATMRIPATNLDIGLEFGIRYLFTDRIDDVSDSYVGLDQFADPLARILSDRSAEPVFVGGGNRETSALLINNSADHGLYASGYVGAGTEGSKRGNPDNDDQLFITQLKLTYHINTNRRSKAKFR